MIEISDSTIHEGEVIQTVWRSRKLVSVDFDQNGEIEWTLEIYIYWDEDKEAEEKEIVLIKVDGQEVGNTVAEYYDIQEGLSSTIDGVIETRYPNTEQEERNKLAAYVENLVVEAIQEEEIDW